MLGKIRIYFALKHSCVSTFRVFKVFFKRVSKKRRKLAGFLVNVIHICILTQRTKKRGQDRRTQLKAHSSTYNTKPIKS